MQIDSVVVASWPAPNHVNPQRRGYEDIVLECSLFALVTGLLVIRVHTRLTICNKKFGWDDIFVLLAYFPATAFSVLDIVGHIVLKWDRHQWDSDPKLGPTNIKMNIALEVLFDLATSLTKLSMLILVYRLTATAKPVLRFMVIATEVVVLVDMLLFAFLTVFQCWPISEAWKLTYRPQNCIDQHTHLFCASIINTATDAAVVFIPIRAFADLHLPPKQRTLVLMLFGGGIAVSGVGAVRTYCTYQYVFSKNGDYIWNSYISKMMASVELYFGLVCAIIPSTTPFFSRLFRRVAPFLRQRNSKTQDSAPTSTRMQKPKFPGFSSNKFTRPSGIQSTPMASSLASGKGKSPCYRIENGADTSTHESGRSRPSPHEHIFPGRDTYERVVMTETAHDMMMASSGSFHHVIDLPTPALKRDDRRLSQTETGEPLAAAESLPVPRGWDPRERSCQLQRIGIGPSLLRHGEMPIKEEPQANPGSGWWNHLPEYIIPARSATRNNLPEFADETATQRDASSTTQSEALSSASSSPTYPTPLRAPPRPPPNPARFTSPFSFDSLGPAQSKVEEPSAI